mgnify:CR=1 FL=1
MATQEYPTIYKRKYTNGQAVSLDDLQTAYEVAAQLVVDHGDQYLPLFERLDQEVQLRQERDTLKDRALAVVEKGQDMLN